MATAIRKIAGWLEDETQRETLAQVGFCLRNPTCAKCFVS
jgi:hypothetical protein